MNACIGALQAVAVSKLALERGIRQETAVHCQRVPREASTDRQVVLHKLVPRKVVKSARLLHLGVLGVAGEVGAAPANLGINHVWVACRPLFRAGSAEERREPDLLRVRDLVALQVHLAVHNLVHVRPGHAVTSEGSVPSLWDAKQEVRREGRAARSRMEGKQRA